MAEDKKTRALLFAPSKPDAEQAKRLKEFIAKKYGPEIQYQWVEDETLVNGFRLVVGEEVYDWTKEGRLHQLEEMLREMKVVKNLSHS